MSGIDYVRMRTLPGGAEKILPTHSVIRVIVELLPWWFEN